MILNMARIAASLAVITAACWWYSDKSTETLTAFFTAIAALCVLFVVPKVTSALATKQSQKVGNNSTGYQANGNINIHEKKDKE